LSLSGSPRRGETCGLARKILSKIEVRSTKFLLKKEKEIKFFSKIAARQRNIFANQNKKNKKQIKIACQRHAEP